MVVSPRDRIFLLTDRCLGWVNQVAECLLGASLSTLVLLLGTRMIVRAIHHGFLMALLLLRFTAIERAHVIGFLNGVFPITG